MGGSSGYDRDVYEASNKSSSSGFSYSDEADRRLNRNYEPVRSQPTCAAPTVEKLAPPEPPPKPKASFSPLNRRLSCTAKIPIVIVLDVTDSASDSVRLVYDKIPMFFGQIVDREYLDDFAVSISGFGDVTCDRSPLQVFDFVTAKQNATGKLLDSYLESMHLERGGGPGTEYRESSDLAAYYYANCVDFAASTERGFLFIVTDERPYDLLERKTIEKHLGGKHKSTSSQEIFEAVQKRYRTYALSLPYRGRGFPEIDKVVRESWQKLLPEAVVEVDPSDPNSVVDQMVGLIATVTGQRTLQTYARDMRERGQTPHRIEIVERAIQSVRLD